ncbi:hypothetical protein KOR42_13360 [Thalassoglobus neptunius]|uniref:Uncharacterized protein n=1 Tax=Thalassoglobus neptunius TaxID=1938619 RepID=A0A5C5X5E3_9PLAN|nr:hypothetical protein KOR42_13360 [Thalassoglobus neptunius]
MEHKVLRVKAKKRVENRLRSGEFRSSGIPPFSERAEFLRRILNGFDEGVWDSVEASCAEFRSKSGILSSAAFTSGFIFDERLATILNASALGAN